MASGSSPMPGSMMGPTDPRDMIYEGVKGIIGVAHTYTLCNRTPYTVKVLLSEDPEGIVITHKGALRLAGDLHNPVGMGVGVTLQGQRGGIRAPSDYTVEAGGEKSLSASSNPVFLMAAFHDRGKFKFIFENRRMDAGSVMHFLDKHLRDDSEAWVQALTMVEAAQIRKAGCQVTRPPVPLQPGEACARFPLRGQQNLPNSKVQQMHNPDSKVDKLRAQQVSVSPRPNTTTMPLGFVPAGSIEIWSQKWQQYVPASILGVAPEAFRDESGQSKKPGSLLIQMSLPDGSSRWKVVEPEQMSQTIKKAGLQTTKA